MPCGVSKEGLFLSATSPRSVAPHMCSIILESVGDGDPDWLKLLHLPFSSISV